SGVRLDEARVRGESGRLVAAIAEVQAKVAETTLQSLQLDEQMRTEVASELREAEGKWAELTERKIVAENELARTQIRAPQSGTVQESTIHTVGGVIGPGEILMKIVPNTDDLVLDALVPPSRADDVRPGQKVTIRFSALDADPTPVCHG